MNHGFVGTTKTSVMVFFSLAKFGSQIDIPF